MKKLKLHEISQDTKISSIVLEDGWKGVVLNAEVCIACNDAEVAQALSHYFGQLAKALKKG